MGFAYDFYLGREEVKFFFNINNIGSYIKALSINYKSVFIEVKNLFKFWDILNFLNSLW